MLLVVLLLRLAPPFARTVSVCLGGSQLPLGFLPLARSRACWCVLLLRLAPLSVPARLGQLPLALPAVGTEPRVLVVLLFRLAPPSRETSGCVSVWVKESS